MKEFSLTTLTDTRFDPSERVIVWDLDGVLNYILTGVVSVLQSAVDEEQQYLKTGFRMEGDDGRLAQAICENNSIERLTAPSIEYDTSVYLPQWAVKQLFHSPVVYALSPTNYWAVAGMAIARASGVKNLILTARPEEVKDYTKAYLRQFPVDYVIFSGNHEEVDTVAMSKAAIIKHLCRATTLLGIFEDAPANLLSIDHQLSCLKEGWRIPVYSVNRTYNQKILEGACLRKIDDSAIPETLCQLCLIR